MEGPCECRSTPGPGLKVRQDGTPFPKIDPSEIDNPGERKVAEALVGRSQAESRFSTGFTGWAPAGGPTHRGEVRFRGCSTLGSGPYSSK